MNMNDFLKGHGVRMCACNAILEKCDCPGHQEVFITVADSCEACKDEIRPDAPIEEVEIEDSMSPSIEAQVMIAEILFNVLGLDPSIERSPRDLGYFLMIAEIQSIRRLCLQQEEILKVVKQICFEMEA